MRGRLRELTLYAVDLDRGSILIEQIVAVALLGLIIAGTLGLLTTGSLAATLARDRTLGAMLAARQLEELVGGPGEPIVVASTPIDGSGLSGSAWQAEVERLSPTLLRVSVTVSWRSAGRRQDVTLTTLARQRVGP